MFERLRGRKALIDEDQWRVGSAVMANSPAYDAWPLTVSLYEGKFSDYLTIYRSSPAVRQAISFIASSIAELPIDFVKADADVREAYLDKALVATFQDPNPESTHFEFIRDYQTDLELFDVTFWIKTRVNGRLLLTRMYPDAVSLEGGSALAPAAFRERYATGDYRDWPRSSVFWVHGYGSRRGVSPMETLRRLLAEDDTAGRARESLARNGYRNAGVISRPVDAPDWDDVGRTRFLDQMASRYSGGSNSGKPLLLEEGMEWSNDAMKLGALEYVAERKMTAERIGALFGLSPAMMKLDQAAYASLTEENRQVYQNVLSPRIKFNEEAFDKWLVHDLAPENVHTKFNLDAKLRGSFKERAEVLAAADYMTKDEKRALMDLPPLTPEQQDELATVAPVAPPNGNPVTDSQPPAPSDDVETGQPKAKAKPEKPRAAVARRDGYASQFETVLTKHFDRMARQAKALGSPVKADRWDRELAKDLRPVSETVVVAEGTRKANQLGGKFDREQVQHYLDAGTKAVASGVNGHAQDIFDRHGDDADAIKVALAAVAVQTAIGQASHLMSFAREEAGKQAGSKRKTWQVTSAQSRHPELDGESVKLGDTFSNGLAYPGDPAGDADQVAGCQCILDIA